MSDRHRRAALALFHLHENDRNWVLERLPERTRNGLMGALCELKDVGAMAVSVAAGRTVAERTFIALQFPAEAVLSVLNGESADCIEAILALEDWPWEKAARRKIDALALSNGRPRASIPERLREALLLQFVNHVEKRLGCKARESRRWGRWW